MRTLAYPVFAILLAFMLVGCNEPEPSFRANMLAYDGGLVGKWRYEDPEEHTINGVPRHETFDLTIEPRALQVSDGRVQPERIGNVGIGPVTSGQSKTRTESPNAYIVTAVVPVSESEAGVQTETIECKGFLIEVDGSKYFTFQPSMKHMGFALLLRMSLPVHQAVKIEREGDRLTVWGPRDRFGWLPEVEWLDAPDQPPDGEPDLSKGHAALHITGDIDRFVAVLLRYGKMEGFWEKPTVLQRVK